MRKSLPDYIRRPWDNWAWDKRAWDERFDLFYHSIASNGVKIRRSSISSPDITWEVEGSNKGRIKSFIILGNPNDQIIFAANYTILGRFESSDKVWSSILSEVKKVKPGTYNGKEFLHSVVPSLGKFLLSNIKKEESTTEGVDHEVQEGGEYVTIESAPLKKQEPELFDFASRKATTKEINDVIEEITRSNASNGITTENIRNVFHFGNKPKEVLERPIFNSTDVEGPKLPEINGGLKILAIGTVCGILVGVLVVACVGLGYLWYRKNREGSYVKKVQKSNGETGNLSEQTQLEHSKATPKRKEKESLPSKVSNATSVTHLSSQTIAKY